jgi:hypothetical protein
MKYFGCAPTSSAVGQSLGLNARRLCKSLSSEGSTLGNSLKRVLVVSSSWYSSTSLLSHHESLVDATKTFQTFLIIHTQLFKNDNV